MHESVEDQKHQETKSKWINVIAELLINFYEILQLSQMYIIP